MNPNEIVSQCFGILGIITSFIIFQQKDRKKLVFFKLISDIVWAVNYFLILAYAGAAIAIIGIFREIFAYNKDKKFAKSILWPIFFIVVGVGAALFMGPVFELIANGEWKFNWFSVLPAAATTISVICLWQSKTKNSRLYAYPISACMLTYNIISLNFTGIANEFLTVSSTTIGYFRNDRVKKTESSEDKNQEN